MKNLTLLMAFILITLTVNAQTNTFPTSGNVGIGTTNPTSKLHITSPSKPFAEGNTSMSANLLVEGTNNTKTTGAGAVLGFVLPANNNGSNRWQQARVYASSDNTNNADAHGRMYLQTRYYNSGTGIWSWRDNLVLRSSGNVGIGTTNPTEKLTVNGKILCEEVEVILDVPAADYVFEKYYNGTSTLKSDYTMPTLEEVEAYTKANHHLPEVPSAQDIKENGLQLKEMTNLLLQKIEELTLYTIEQEKRIKALEGQLTSKK